MLTRCDLSGLPRGQNRWRGPRKPAGHGRRFCPPYALIRLRDSAPLVRLQADNQLVTTAAVRPEDGGLAFAHVEPILAERIHDVRLVGDDDDVRVGWRHCPG